MGPSIQISNQDNAPTNLPIRKYDSESFWVKVPSSQVTLCCVKLTIKTREDNILISRTQKYDLWWLVSSHWDNTGSPEERASVRDYLYWVSLWEYLWKIILMRSLIDLERASPLWKQILDYVGEEKVSRVLASKQADMQPFISLLLSTDMLWLTVPSSYHSGVLSIMEYNLEM